MKNKEVDIRSCAIIGCGNVGAATAYALMHSKLLSKLVLIDLNEKKAYGEAEDISHALPFNSPMDITSGDYCDLADCGIIIITAGMHNVTTNIPSRASVFIDSSFSSSFFMGATQFSICLISYLKC